MGIPLLMGRDCDDREELVDATLGERGRPPFRVAIANERFVQHYFGDRNPIGRRIGFGADPNTPTPIEIVGVVGDAKYTDVPAPIPDSQPPIPDPRSPARDLFQPSLRHCRPSFASSSSASAGPAVPEA